MISLCLNELLDVFETHGPFVIQGATKDNPLTNVVKLHHASTLPFAFLQEVVNPFSHVRQVQTLPIARNYLPCESSYITTYASLGPSSQVIQMLGEVVDYAKFLPEYLGVHCVEC